MIKINFIFLLAIISVLIILLAGCVDEELESELIISGIPFGLERAAIKSISVSEKVIDLIIESEEIAHNVSIQPGLSKNYNFDVDELVVTFRYKPDGPIRYLKFTSKGDPRVFLVKGGRERNIFFPEFTLRPGAPLNARNDETDSRRERVSIILSRKNQDDRVLLPGAEFPFHKDNIDWIFMYLYASVQKTETQSSNLVKIATESPHFLVDWIVYRK